MVTNKITVKRSHLPAVPRAQPSPTTHFLTTFYSVKQPHSDVGKSRNVCCADKMRNVVRVTYYVRDAIDGAKYWRWLTQLGKVPRQRPPKPRSCRRNGIVLQPKLPQRWGVSGDQRELGITNHGLSVQGLFLTPKAEDAIIVSRERPF